MRGLCLKENNRLGANWSAVPSLRLPNTGYQSRIREQELFFCRFAMKVPFFGLHYKIREILRIFRDEDLCFLVHRRELEVIKFLCLPPRKLFMSPQSLSHATLAPGQFNRRSLIAKVVKCRVVECHWTCRQE